MELYSTTTTVSSPLRDRLGGDCRHGHRRRGGGGDVVDDDDSDDMGSTFLSSSAWNTGNDGYDNNNYGGDRQEDSEEERRRRRSSETRERLDAKTGRLWTDPWDVDEMIASKINSYDDLPDWSPNLVSRVSQERVKIHPAGIPTLRALAGTALPPPPPPHPGSSSSPKRGGGGGRGRGGGGGAKAYALYRKREQYKYISEKVTELAEPRVASIQSLPTWDDKQDAVDELFEDIEFDLKRREEILGKHPKFGEWVERALEQYLRDVQSSSTAKDSDDDDDVVVAEGGQDDDDDDDNSQSVPDLGADRQEEDESSSVPLSSSSSSQSSQSSSKSSPYPSAEEDACAVPIFMDCYDAADGTGGDAVPSILNPLKPHPRIITVGRMVEEWELSAHETTRRIMLRQSTRAIARALLESSSSSSSSSSTTTAAAGGGRAQPPPRIYVCGERGAGKSAALASIVAAARKSGYLVLYLPDGDQLRRNGFYVEPNARRSDVYDLPVLSRDICDQFLTSHGNDLTDTMSADAAALERYFTEDQLERLHRYNNSNNEGRRSGGGGGGSSSMTVADLLKIGSEKTNLAAPCYAVAVEALSEQTERPFLMVLDEFNCYYDRGHYFHGDYDETVKRSIPYNAISLFQPAMDAMSLSVKDDDGDHDDKEGTKAEPETETAASAAAAVIVATTESHAVAKRVTDALTNSARRRRATTSGSDVGPLHVVEVPRLSPLEVDHMLANYEATGVGKLRLDQGETIMNEQEVAFLRLVSGAIPQRLLDACII